MSADLLRRAAASMREHAEAALLACGDEPWQWEFAYPGYNVSNSVGVAVMENGTEETADYVASWHPAVALATAGLLDLTAQAMDVGAEGCADLGVPFALTDAGQASVRLARAYLGESA